MSHTKRLAKSQDLVKMTRPQLEALVKGIMKVKDIKTLKVDQLRAHVKKLAEANPGLLQIPTANAARTVVVHVVSTEPSTIPATTNTQANPQNCSVLEVKLLYYIYMSCRLCTYFILCTSYVSCRLFISCISCILYVLCTRFCILCILFIL